MSVGANKLSYSLALRGGELLKNVLNFQFS